uniref:Uncharacterized protein n=1 Tax=Lepeophtheirus salmonis TaxID=72036 RepID=A0A0K2U9P6_LEPSM
MIQPFTSSSDSQIRRTISWNTPPLVRPIIVTGPTTSLSDPTNISLFLPPTSVLSSFFLRCSKQQLATKAISGPKRKL